jgi:hypothetical protein
VTRRACLTICSLAALLVPMAAQAQLQKVTYLLPSSSTLPAFGPWVLAQAKGYYAAEGLEVEFLTLYNLKSGYLSAPLFLYKTFNPLSSKHHSTMILVIVSHLLKSLILSISSTK